MIRCPKHKKYATHKAEVTVCPQCGAILDAEQLKKLLKQLGINHTIIDRIKAAQVFSKL